MQRKVVVAVLVLGLLGVAIRLSILDGRSPATDSAKLVSLSQLGSQTPGYYQVNAVVMPPEAVAQPELAETLAKQVSYDCPEGVRFVTRVAGDLPDGSGEGIHLLVSAPQGQEKDLEEGVQLLRGRWYPAGSAHPGFLLVDLTKSDPGKEVIP